MSGCGNSSCSCGASCSCNGCSCKRSLDYIPDLSGMELEGFEDEVCKCGANCTATHVTVNQSTRSSS